MSSSRCDNAHRRLSRLRSGLTNSEMQMIAKNPATEGWILLKLGLSMTSSLCCVQNAMTTEHSNATRNALVAFSGLSVGAARFMAVVVAFDGRASVSLSSHAVPVNRSCGKKRRRA